MCLVRVTFCYSVAQAIHPDTATSPLPPISGSADTIVLVSSESYPYIPESDKDAACPFSQYQVIAKKGMPVALLMSLQRISGILLKLLGCSWHSAFYGSSNFQSRLVTHCQNSPHLWSLSGFLYAGCTLTVYRFTNYRTSNYVRWQGAFCCRFSLTAYSFIAVIPSRIYGSCWHLASSRTIE